MSRQGFTGVRFKTPPTLPTIKPKEEVKPIFPTETRAAGVTMGESLCETCGTIFTQGKVSICTSCGGSFIKSFRQELLSKAYDNYVGVAHLRREPDNPYDRFAVGIYLNIDSKLQRVGYVPSKKKDNCFVTSEEVSTYLASGSTLWTKCRVIGGPQENDSDRSWGLIIWIFDKPPTD